MQAYVFRSDAGIFAPCAKQSERDLPVALGPWSRLKCVVVDDERSGRIDLTADEVATLRRNHYVLLRNGLVIDDA